MTGLASSWLLAESTQVPLAGIRHGSEMELDIEQLQALVLGLPWQRVGSGAAITLL